MPIENALWTVSSSPASVPQATLPSEQVLEEMIVAEPSILSSEWMLVGRQVETGHGGRIDLLAIAPDGSLIIIELKRERTPREVVAQALDYASWVEGLDADDISQIYSRFKPGRSLAEDYLKQCGHHLDEDSINESHQVVIVASQLDAASERIVAYLNDRGIGINVLFFRVFNLGGQALLSRTWLVDPAQLQVQASASGSKGDKEPWNGEYYVSFGADGDRRWDEAMKYGFISGGGGAWYSNTLNMLDIGDRVWVKIPGKGFVGVGRVSGKRANSDEFMIDGQPASQVLEGGSARANSDDPTRREYFVPVEWIKTLPEDKAIHEIGMFGNQNTVCRPRTPTWRSTVAQLKDRLGVD